MDRFPIVYLSRDDVRTALEMQHVFSEAQVDAFMDRLTDDQMTELASRMADDYVNQLFLG